MADRGRSRGRARGRAATTPVGATGGQPMDVSDISLSTISGDNGGNGGSNGGNGNGSAVRSRASFRNSNVRTRPDNLQSTRGTGGRAVTLVANYFRLNTPRDVVVYDYHIDFIPDVVDRVVRKGLLFTEAILQAFGQRLLFDGMSNVKSTVRLPTDEAEFFAVRRSDGQNIRIRVRRVGEIAWGHQEMYRLYNTQMRKNMRLLGWNLIGRHYFNPAIRHAIPEHKLEVLQGLLTAINAHDGGVLMVADTVHKVIRQDTVLDNLREIHRRDPQGFNVNARRELAGQVVITQYNNKTYRIDDIAFDKNPETTFDRKGTPVSFLAYYQQHHDRLIRDQRQPLLIAMPSLRDQRAGQTEQILLVPELCNMTGISDSMANDFTIRRQLTQRTQQDPNQRVTGLRQFIGSMASHQLIRQDMSRWGLEFDNNLVEVPGRVLDCERVLMHGQTPQTGTLWDQKAGDFSKEIRGRPMYGAININNWSIIVSRRDNNIVQEFINKLQTVCQPLGIAVSRPNVTVIDNDRTSGFVEASNAIPPSCQIIVVILPNNNKDRYDAIKKIFCCEHPMASQLVVKRTLGNPARLMSVCTKIGIQMACKLGAEPWVLEIPPPNLMVVGFDVNRDSAQRERAIGAFVCSTNATLTKWYSCVSQHTTREELSNNFKINLQNGMKRWYEANKRPPQTIVVYRDGVGEGDIEHVFNYELKQIQDAINTIFKDIPIKLCFTIVTKRINTRLFQPSGQNHYMNPIPGTVADAVVTREERYDFYLISQSVRQGTVTPTMYNIILDDTHWAPHRHQQLAYKLTHLYYNWIGTIRVPAPCQYAHKLAFLTGTALHRPFHARLADTLFYL